MSPPLELDPLPASVRQARDWIRGFAVEHGRSADADTLVLLVSELVSNVVLHARTPCTLQASVTADGSVRVEVLDGASTMPRRGRYQNVEATSGRGLLLVEAMATAHGADLVDGGGKRVWFDLAPRGGS